MSYTNETAREFERLEDITPQDVQWLKDGSEITGRRVNNPRHIAYRTKRGKAKACTCFVMSDGSVKWRTWTARNSSDGLSTEEARVFAPEIAKKREERAAKYRAEKREAQNAGRAVKVGDVFAGSFGYDATIWCFHEVVRVSETGKTIWTRELKHETAPGYGFNDWKCRPSMGNYRGGTEKHRVQYSTWDKEPRPYFTQDSCVTPYLIDDPAQWFSADNYH